MQRKCELTKPHVIAVGCNGDNNTKNCNFNGTLFDNKEKICPLCGETAAALLHVCDNCILKTSNDRLCVNCSVRALQTSESANNKIFWLQQGNCTTFMTAIFGIAVLEEISNIIRITKIDACYDIDKWHWQMEFGKPFKKNENDIHPAFLDLEVIISYDNEDKFYIAGKKMLIVCCL